MNQPHLHGLYHPSKWKIWGWWIHFRWRTWANFPVRKCPIHSHFIIVFTFMLYPHTARIHISYLHISPLSWHLEKHWKNRGLAMSETLLNSPFQFPRKIPWFRRFSTEWAPGPPFSDSHPNIAGWISTPQWLFLSHLHIVPTKSCFIP